MNKSEITGHTALYGIFANPIKHSISPAMHNEAFKALGLDCVYLAFEVDSEDFSDCMRAIRAMNIRGANISMPYKERTMEYMDEISEEAKLIGAINTIVNENGRLKGHNTDGTGFMRSLAENGVYIKGRKLTIAGCGGAATAIITQAALDGAGEISVFIRKSSFEKRQHIIDRVNKNTNASVKLFDLSDMTALRKEAAESVALINATSLGMKPNEDKTWLKDVDILSSTCVCVDAIYSPPKTKFLETAESAGCRIINGSGMLLYQGAAAFKLWTGMDMPIEQVRKAVGL